MDTGALVPDDVMIGLIAERLRQPDAAGGFILDGFPRTIAQAEALDRLLKELGQKLDGVVYFDVSEPELVRRLTGRRLCRQCQTAFHLVSAPPRRAGGLRSVRRRALPARGRQRGDRAPSAAGVRAADLAAARLLPPSQPAGARSRARARSTDIRADIRRAGGGPMIELKSAREVGLMRRAGHILADVDGPAARRGQAGHVHAGDRRGRGGLHPRARGQARLQGLSRLSRHRVHLDQRGSGARHPVGAAPGQGGRHRRPRPRVYRGRVLRRLCVHAGDRRGAAAGSAAARRHPGEPRARHQGVPAGPSPLRRLARRPAARREPSASRSCAPSSATASAGPCTRSPRCRTSATRAAARSCGRAWCWRSSRW